jgi:hypothetical protein
MIDKNKKLATNNLNFHFQFENISKSLCLI